jgi:SnoaL-like domain
MEQSEDVRRFLSSLVETFGTAQMASAFAGALAAEPGVLMVGTDPAEWWDDREKLLQAMQAQSSELRGAAATVSHAEGWVQGGIGWGAVKADVVFPDRSATQLRITATLARRPSGWKIVQCHASVGAPNEEIVGKELTV